MASLAQYDEMQRRPFGTNTALSKENAYGVGGSAGSQIRKTGAAYARALRILDRQARRGDANSALQAIKTRGEANAEGFSPGGIQRKDELDKMTVGRIASDAQADSDMQQAQTVQRNRNAFLNNQWAPQPAAPATPATPNTRLYAGLDVLEGAKARDSGGSMDQFNTGVTNARSLGVVNPNTILQGDQNLKYRQTLDTALGQAQTPEQIAALKARGTRYGVPAEAFDRRAKWWETNRR